MAEQEILTSEQTPREKQDKTEYDGFASGDGEQPTEDGRVNDEDTLRSQDGPEEDSLKSSFGKSEDAHSARDILCNKDIESGNEMKEAKAVLSENTDTRAEFQAETKLETFTSETLGRNGQSELDAQDQDLSGESHETDEKKDNAQPKLDNQDTKSSTDGTKSAGNQGTDKKDDAKLDSQETDNTHDAKPELIEVQDKDKKTDNATPESEIHVLHQKDDAELESENQGFAEKKSDDEIPKLDQEIHGETNVTETTENTSETKETRTCDSSDQIAGVQTSVRLSDDPDRREQIRATLYGQCVGDAIGLLTEFMSIDEAQIVYKDHADQLEYKHKRQDRHRARWKEGDWTDDSDQMIVIMQSLAANDGQIIPGDFADRLKKWGLEGFPNLGDTGGMGIGRTTHSILTDPEFLDKPEKVAKKVWVKGRKNLAPNGGVMRTSILGVHEWWDTDFVEENALKICRTTHFDPRCQASAVAVSVAISLMLQRQSKHWDGEKYDVNTIIQDSYDRAARCLETKQQKDELREFMECEDVSKLYLAEPSSVGYTYKCLGAGFWGLKQENFRAALQRIVMIAGDADTNGAVAGALLACKLGHVSALPESWVTNLLHKDWLEEQLKGYMEVLERLQKNPRQKTPESGRSCVLM